MNTIIRGMPQYKVWQGKILERDDYTCQNCGRKQGEITLHVHHIISIKELIKEFGITTEEDALNCKEIWDTTNGIVLCEECHFTPKVLRKYVYVSKPKKVRKAKIIRGQDFRRVGITLKEKHVYSIEKRGLNLSKYIRNKLEEDFPEDFGIEVIEVQSKKT